MIRQSNFWYLLKRIKISISNIIYLFSLDKEGSSVIFDNIDES